MRYIYMYVYIALCSYLLDYEWLPIGSRPLSNNVCLAQKYHQTERTQKRYNIDLLNKVYVALHLSAEVLRSRNLSLPVKPCPYRANPVIGKHFTIEPQLSQPDHPLRDDNVASLESETHWPLVP